jgi:hypothetical protein
MADKVKLHFPYLPFNGKHHRCKACGTNPRALGTNPRAVHAALDATEFLSTLAEIYTVYLIAGRRLAHPIRLCRRKQPNNDYVQTAG